MVPRTILCSFLFLGVFVFARAGTESEKALGAYLGQHDYCAVAVDADGRNTQIVKAKVNGRSISLIIDTGFPRTTLSASCGRHLKLAVQDAGFQDNGVGGAVKGDMDIALIESFKLADFDINRTNTIMVLPKSAYSGGEDGFLGFDFLHLNAMILPVGASVLLFKPGTHPPPPLEQFLAPMGFKAIPLHYEAGGLRVEGELNGQPLNAIVDSGSDFTTFDYDYVQKVAGSHFETLKGMRRGVDGNQLVQYGFTPQQISVGPLHLDPIEIVADKSPLFSHTGANALLGYDMLAEHRAIIDFGHDVLWMK